MLIKGHDITYFEQIRFLICKPHRVASHVYGESETRMVQAPF